MGFTNIENVILALGMWTFLNTGVGGRDVHELRLVFDWYQLPGVKLVTKLVQRFVFRVGIPSPVPPFVTGLCLLMFDRPGEQSLNKHPVIMRGARVNHTAHVHIMTVMG